MKMFVSIGHGVAKSALHQNFAKSQVVRFYYSHTLLVNFCHSCPHSPTFSSTMPNTSVPQRPQHSMATRASNKQAHPGEAIKAKKRRTREEVQQECEAKERAKAAQ
jgi:hypothetical protein